MIKTLLTLVIFIVLASYNLHSQCAAYTANTACTSAAPINATPISCTPPTANGGRRNFVVTNMLAGATYRVSNCGSGFDTQMTIRDNGGAVIAYNDDGGPACAGLASSIDFIPPATGDYRIQMNRYNCATAPASVGTITVIRTAGPPTSYCVPVSSNNTYYIDDFNATGTTVLNNDSGIGITSPGYSDYTSLSVTQLEGGIINFDVDVNGTFSTLGINIWVDWNDDAVFSPAEKVYASGGYVTDAAGSFTIPGGTAGSHRMRILGDYWEADPNPCFFDSFGPFGEAEDYTLIVTPLNCTADPQNLTAISPTTTSGTVSWNAPTPPPANGYEYIISTDNTTTTPAGDITGTTTGTSLNLTGLTPNTTYYVFVRGVCNATDNGVWITTSFNTGCADLDNTPNSCEMVIDQVGNNPFAITPYNADPSFVLDCNTGSVNLATNAQMYETTSYDVIKIPYQYIGSIGATIDNTPISQDDRWADTPTNIGFPFCFYDDTKTDVLVGANSIITFEYDNNTSTFTPTPGDGSGFQIDTNLPSIGSGTGTFRNAMYEQAIYGVYHDIDPTGIPANSITTRTQGFVGCRKFIAEWNDVPMFSDPSRVYSGMIVLYETTNIIEVYIEEKRIENGNVSPWNDGNAIVGIQGDYVGPVSNPANEYAVAPCRNALDDNWEVTNEAWRFVPSGNSRLTGVEWYIGTNTSGTPVATTNTYTATAPGTYTAISTYSTCGGPTVTLTDQVFVSGGNTWTSAAGTSDWNTAGNWSNNTVPTDSDLVIIPDATTTAGRFPIILGGAPLVSMAGCLTLENNGYVEVRNGGRLIVTGAITVEESATLTDGNLLIRSGGNLVQITEGPTNTNNNTGPIKMQRSVTGVASDSYIYWSSPVEAFNVQSVSPGSSNIFEWIPTTGSVYGNWVSPTNPTMTQGKGYIIRNILGTNPEAGTITPIGTTAEFIGVPRNGVLTTPINRGNHLTGTYPGAGNTLATPLDDNWNLIGNPYPSSISADEFISENAANITNDVNPAISGTIWLWRHENTTSNITNDPFYGDYVYNYNANQYAAYNLSGSNPAGFNGNIASGQGFFVLMEDLVGPGPTPILNADITFTNTMRYSGDNDAFDNTSFLRTETDESTTSNSIERHRIWLDLIKPDNTATSILVGYIENATNDIDRLYDGYDLNTYGVRLYSIIDDKELSIQGRTLPFDQDDIVPLGVVIGDNGIHQIAINAIDGLFENESQGIYLEDTYTNTIHDLRANTYSFTSESGTFNDRFILRYTDETLGVNSAQIDSGISIIAPRSEYIKISSSIGVIQTVNIYDVLGRVIFSEQNINNHEFILNDTNLANGAYIVKVELTNGKQKIKTVVLKH